MQIAQAFACAFVEQDVADSASSFSFKKSNKGVDGTIHMGRLMTPLAQRNYRIPPCVEENPAW